MGRKFLSARHGSREQKSVERKRIRASIACSCPCNSTVVCVLINNEHKHKSLKQEDSARVRFPLIEKKHLFFFLFTFINLKQRIKMIFFFCIFIIFFSNRSTKVAFCVQQFHLHSTLPIIDTIVGKKKLPTAGLSSARQVAVVACNFASPLLEQST